MKKACIYCCAILFLAACGEKQAPQQEPTTAAEPDLSIVIGEKIGLITPSNCSREGILAAYGKDAIEDSLYIVDGMYDKGVVLFPDNPRRRVEINWNDENDKAQAYIRIKGDSTGVSDWKTSEGITIGTPITEITKLNGKAFNFFGFGWDYGGMLTNWNGGKFTTALGLQFEAKGDDSKVSGDQELKSDDPNVLAAQVVVSEMEFRFLANGELPGCIMELVKADKEQAKMVVFKMDVNGATHYWLQSGAAAYDGIEYIYEVDKAGKCKEVCTLGGMRMPIPCMKVYEGKQWELVWEEP